MAQTQDSFLLEQIKFLPKDQDEKSLQFQKFMEANFEYKDGIFFVPKNTTNVMMNETKIFQEGKENYILEPIKFQKGLVVLKIPKRANSIIKNYYIGKKLNSLVKTVPTFPVTLSICSKSDSELRPFIIQEYIIGKTIEQCLNDLTFEQFLNIFFQLLLTLEFAQRNLSFCHYDLQLSNIIICKRKIKYKVNIDNLSYIITTDIIPVIIDYGLSSIAEIWNNFIIPIGVHGYEKHGIFNVPLQGVDMYKFLFSSFCISKPPLKEKIGRLFTFYGSNDPYNILKSTNEEIKIYSTEYVKKASFSIVAINIPLEFMKWILRNPIYSFLKNVIKIKERKEEKIINEAKNILEFSFLEIPKYKNYKNCLKFLISFEPYLEFYFSKKSKGERFKLFKNIFKSSLQFKFYKKIVTDIEKKKRWNQTVKMIDSISSQNI